MVWVGRDDYEPMGLSGGMGALRVWGGFMLAMDNEQLSESPPDGVVLANACGRSNVPYIGSSAKGAGGCGGGDGGGGGAKPAARTSGGEKRVAEAPSKPAEASQETPAPKPPPKPKPPSRPENHFMSDFYN